MSHVDPFALDLSKMQTKLLINNEWCDAVSGKKFDVFDPATGKVCAKVAEADAADVDLAVAAARAAFKKYRTTDGPFRRNLMLKLAELVEKNAEELAALESLDNGKPFLQAFGMDVQFVVNCFRYYAGWADKVQGTVTPAVGNTFCFTRKEPVGVCGQIIPWNFPLLMAAWKLGPALALGNTVVLKPAEQTPLTALRLGELIVEAGYPAGVVNIVPGFGPTAGARISSHPDINKVAFTGSTEIGHLIMKSAAETNLKRVSLELGGKSPFIICADADVDKAAQAAANGIFFNMGQVCTASSRLFVHESIHDEFVAKVKANAEARKIGAGRAKDSDQGPLVSKEQHDRVLGYIEKGKQEGATCVTGGERALTEGYFVKPTVFTNVTDSMTIAKEEIFGPVVTVLKFKDVDEVIERANKTTFGLAAGVFTKDINTAFKFSSFIEAGTVWVNCWNVFDSANAFGGFKESGLGRELGEAGLHAYTETKTVVIALEQPLVR
jgi:aldehyde dehydrogenase (NAD+)